MPYSSCCLSLDTAWASTRLYLSSAARSTPVTLCCSKKRQLYQTPKRRAACAGNTVLAGSSQHLRPIAAASRWAPGVRHCRPPARKRRAAAPRCSTTDTAELQGQLDGRIWTLLVPAIAAVFFDPLMALTDTAIVGRLGTEALGAVGLSNLIFFFCTVLFSFLLAVTTPRTAQAKAQGKHQQASLETAHALWIAAALGVAVGAALWWCAPWLMLQVFKVSKSQAGLGITHLRIRSLGSPATLILFVTNGAFRGITDTRTPLLAGVAQNSINFVLDVGLVLGLHWGVAGAASAAAAAFYVGAATMGGMLVAKGVLQPVHLLSLPSPEEVGRLVQQGAPLVCCIGAVVAAIFTATNLATGLGPEPLAAHTIVKQITDFCLAFFGSFSTVAQCLVASCLGKGNQEEARMAVRRLLQVGLGIGAVLVGVLLVGNSELPGLFSKDPTVVGQASAALKLVAFSMLLAPCATTLEGTLLGTEAYAWVGGRTILSACAAITVLLGASQLHLGLVGIWLGLVSLVAMNGLLDAYWLLRPQSPLALLQLPNQPPWESHRQHDKAHEEHTRT